MSRTRGVVVRQSLPATWPGSGALSLRGLLRGSFAATPPDAPGPGRHCGVAPCFETPEPGVVTSAGRRVAVVSQGCSVQTPKKPAGGSAATAGSHRAASWLAALGLALPHMGCRRERQGARPARERRTGQRSTCSGLVQPRHLNV